MAYPGHRELDDVLLCFVLLNGGCDRRVAAAAAYEPLADFFGLKHYERVAPRRGGHRGKEWHMRVQLARRRLVHVGPIIKPSREGADRGHWTLSPEGVCRARQFVASHAWKDEDKATSVKVEGQVTSRAAKVPPAPPPSDRLEVATITPWWHGRYSLTVR